MKDAAVPYLDPRRSIFTSEFFTLFRDELSPHFYPTRFDGTLKDLQGFANSFGTFLGPVTCGLDTGIAFTADGKPVVAHLDPINFELSLAMYYLKQHAKVAKFYFPTDALLEALEHTELTWVDMQAFEDLPPCVGIRTKGFQIKVSQEVHVCDDILVMKDSTPGTRERVLNDHRVPQDARDTAIVLHWLTQSRDEIKDGIQSQTFGTIAIHKHMKLDAILEELDAWSRRETQRILGEVQEHDLLNVVADHAAHSRDLPEYMNASREESSQLIQNHALYLKDSLSQASWDEEQRKWNLDILRFIFKFVMLLSTDAARIKLMPPPGVKEKANPSRKAKKIQEHLWEQWGRRYSVDIPPITQEQIDERKSPTRHIVHGHFKNQPYGPQHSLRKNIWILPFWRGSISLGKD